MNAFKQRNLVCFAALMLALCQTIKAKDVIVEGFVFDESGQPVVGAEIKIWQDSKPYGNPVSTWKDGAYKIIVPEGGRIDLEYSHSKMDPTVVEHLSGTKSHTISKVLYPTGKEKQFGVAYQQLLDFESVAVLQLQLVSGPTKDWERKNYYAKLFQFKLTTDATERQRSLLTNKLIEVQKLYQTINR